MLACFRNQTKLIWFNVAGTNWSIWGSGKICPLSNTGHCTISVCCQLRLPSWSSQCWPDTDLKNMCNYTSFKRRVNKILSRQRLILDIVSTAPVLPPESVRRDRHLGKAVHPVLTPPGWTLCTWSSVSSGDIQSHIKNVTDSKNPLHPYN